MGKLCASCLSLSLLLACSDSPTEPSGNMPFTTLATSKIANTAGPQIQAVVRDEATWRQVWSDLWGDRVPALPAVDFSRDLAVIVTGSEICFGGAVVEEIVHTGAELRIRYGDAASSLCLCVAPELSFHAVRAPRVGGEARFEARQTPPLCPT